MNIEKLYQIFRASKGVETDTRKIQPGSLFFCLRGENFNANEFAHEALIKGAMAVVIDEEEYYKDDSTILVNDSLKTMQQLANYHRRQFDIHHPLLSMYIQKIRYAMKKHIEVNYCNDKTMLTTLNKMTNSEIWYRWFPKQISGIGSPEFMLQNTWLRPRDLSRLFRTMKKYSKKGSTSFIQKSYEEAIKKVGEDSWQEIEEELSSIYTEKELRAIITILEKMQILFMKDKFIAEAYKYGFDKEVSIKILHNLYRLSAIGNAYKSFNNHRFTTTYRFAYRNDKSLYEDKSIYVHRVIQHALGLTDFKSDFMIEHLSEEDKKKYKSKEYMQSRNHKTQKGKQPSQMAFNLQDMLKESEIRVK